MAAKVRNNKTNLQHYQTDTMWGHHSRIFFPNTILQSHAQTQF